MRKILYIFSELQDNDMHWLACAGETRSLIPGQEVVREHTLQEHVYIVLEGNLRATRGGLETGHLGSGEVVGDLSMLEATTAKATVTAVDECKLFEIPQHLLRNKLSEDPQFGCRFYRALGVYLNKSLQRNVRSEGPVSLADALADDTSDDELSAGMLDGIAAAGARFDWFRQQVEGL